jgi:hypothetical protein
MAQCASAVTAALWEGADDLRDASEDEVEWDSDEDEDQDDDVDDDDEEKHVAALAELVPTVPRAVVAATLAAHDGNLDRAATALLAGGPAPAITAEDSDDGWELEVAEPAAPCATADEPAAEDEWVMAHADDDDTAAGPRLPPTVPLPPQPTALAQSAADLLFDDLADEDIDDDDNDEDAWSEVGAPVPELSLSMWDVLDDDLDDDGMPVVPLTTAAVPAVAALHELPDVLSVPSTPARVATPPAAPPKRLYSHVVASKTAGSPAAKATVAGVTTVAAAAAAAAAMTMAPQRRAAVGDDVSDPAPSLGEAMYDVYKASGGRLPRVRVHDTGGRGGGRRDGRHC